MEEEREREERDEQEVLDVGLAAERRQNERHQSLEKHTRREVDLLTVDTGPGCSREVSVSIPGL